MLCDSLLGAVGVGPASIMVGNLVAGKRMAQAVGRELGMVEDQDLIRKVPASHRTSHHGVADLHRVGLTHARYCPGFRHLRLDTPLLPF